MKNKKFEKEIREFVNSLNDNFLKGYNHIIWKRYDYIINILESLLYEYDYKDKNLKNILNSDIFDDNLREFSDNQVDIYTDDVFKNAQDFSCFFSDYRFDMWDISSYKSLEGLIKSLQYFVYCNINIIIKNEFIKFLKNN